MRAMLFVVLLFALLFTGSLALAQEVTAEPTAEATPTPLPPVETPTEDGFDLREFLSGIAVGAITALAAVFGIVGRLKNDKPALDAIEWLGRSVPADVLLKLNQLGSGARDAGEVLVKVTDGKPNE